jgi:hypothetical protein
MRTNNPCLCLASLSSFGDDISRNGFVSNAIYGSVTKTKIDFCRDGWIDLAMEARETSRNANIWSVAFVCVALYDMIRPPLGACRTKYCIFKSCRSGSSLFFYIRNVLNTRVRSLCSTFHAVR